ncbi:hypothetical protein [Pseudophaeobacter arcticus]|uniref:hypothetical protein n=1 Tax=Pseudophaeobacter arcticus TaxID=385492 RepID=UPI003A974BC4
MRLFLCSFLFVVSVLPAVACPVGSETLVSCSLKNGSRMLTTCLQGDQVSYAFGRSGAAPDLTLQRNVRDVHMVPWPGIGRSIWEEFTFENEGTYYTVYYSLEKDPDVEQPWSGGVIVEQGGRELAHLHCDSGSVNSSGYALPLFEAKERAGQVYSLETGSWQ